MTSKSIITRLAKIQAKHKLTQMPLVIFYRAVDGIGSEQIKRIDARRSCRPVKIIKTFVAGGGL